MSEKRWYKKPEMLIALSAILISVVTAFVEIYSANADRKYASASVWPRLEILRSYGPDKFLYQVSNNGIGPAIIKYAKVQHKSKIITQWNQITGVGNFVQSHIGSRIVPPQSAVIPFETHDKENAGVMFKEDEQIEIEVCYCSVFYECWLSNRENQPKQIDECLIDEASRFLQ